MTRESAKRVVIVGAGGNVGSHLVAHVARLPNVGEITLIDRDVYEKKNLASQDIVAADVGRWKVRAQARRVQRIDASISVTVHAEEVERLPLGALRSDVILACVDSRIARQTVNEMAWRLGVPWIDSGVLASGLLARVSVYVPGAGPCVECGWDERDYAALEQGYPCPGKTARPAATNGPSSLGALAASLQAIECSKLLAGYVDTALIGREVLVDAAFHRHYATDLRRNPECRFDHGVWTIVPLEARPQDLTLGAALELGSVNGGASLQVANARFAARTICGVCGAGQEGLILARSLGGRAGRCRACRGELWVSGFDLREELKSAELDSAALKRRLSSFGVRRTDVLTIGTRHFRMVGARAANAAGR